MPRRDTLFSILESDTIETAAQRRAAPTAIGAMHARPADRPRRKRMMLVSVPTLLLVAAAVVSRWPSSPAVPAYGSAAVHRGDIAKTISATGKLQAVTTVQVGTQVSGTISELYADFNSRVTKGQVIARLDPSQLQVQLAQVGANYAGAQAGVQTAQSSLLAAEAGVQAAEANLERAAAALDDAQRTFDHTRQLVEVGAAPRRQLDPAQAAVAQAAAQRQQATAQLNQVKVESQGALSQLNQARAQADQAQAAVQLASVNIDRTVIRAPIDGVVIARNVDVGQTVAASLQAPTIFLIANDLTRMRVLADIDEADVGQLGQGARVKFTVDAYPSDVFEGDISQIRLSPQTVQNVVTYTAVVDVNNPDLKLKPGMTASVTARVAEAKGVLTVPNAALRFRPEPAVSQQTAARAPQNQEAGIRRNGGGQTIWKLEGETLAPVPVQLGLTDGISTEVVSGNVEEGDRIAVPGQPAGAAAVRRPVGKSPFQSAGGGRR